jgi:methionyl-tRNA formyltransferase
LFITQDDPFYIRLFFEEFLKYYSDKNEISGVVICPTMGEKTIISLINQMYSFYGIRDFCKMTLRYLSAKFKGDTLENICRHYDITVHKECDINSDLFLDYWREKNLDVIVSVAAPTIFKKGLLELPNWGCINIHHAKLPFYRGMMPNFWQMYHSEENAGITVHRINAGIDEGEIILQREIPIEKDDSLDSLIKRSKKIGAHCIIEALDMIKKCSVTYISNHKEKGSYFSFPSREEVREFKRRGKKIL